MSVDFDCPEAGGEGMFGFVEVFEEVKGEVQCYYPYVCTGYGGYKSGAGNCSGTFVTHSPEDADVGAVGRKDISQGKSESLD